MEGYLINEKIIIGKDIAFIGALDSNVIFACEFLKPRWWVDNVSQKNMRYCIRILEAQIKHLKKNYFNTDSEKKSIEIIKKALNETI